MPQPPPSTGSPRGRRRREDIVTAGLELLDEQGWAALTVRAIAERSGANAGLVHYYWAGLPGLKAEIARRAVGDAVEPALEVLTSARTWTEGMAAVVAASASEGPAPSRRGAELVAASLHDPVVAAAVGSTLQEARARVSGWLAASGVEHPEGTATLVLATLDGLLLHRIIDPVLPLREAATAAEAWGRPAGGG